MHDQPVKQFRDVWPNFDKDFEELKRRGFDVARIAFETRPPDDEAEQVEVEAES